MHTIEDRLKDLFERALAGQADAYRQFLVELARLLRGFFRKRAYRTPDLVEDLVQETLLAVHNQRHTYDSAQPLTAWIRAIARYKFIDMLRAYARQDALNEPFDDSHELFSRDDAESDDARRDIGRMLADLPERQRLPIVHMKLEGLSVTETARITGMSESAVKVGVHRGLKALALRFRSTT